MRACVRVCECVGAWVRVWVWGYVCVWVCVCMCVCNGGWVGACACVFVCGCGRGWVCTRSISTALTCVLLLSFTMLTACSPMQVQVNRHVEVPVDRPGIVNSDSETDLRRSYTLVCASRRGIGRNRGIGSDRLAIDVFWMRADWI